MCEIIWGFNGFLLSFVKIKQLKLILNRINTLQYCLPTFKHSKKNSITTPSVLKITKPWPKFVSLINWHYHIWNEIKKSRINFQSKIITLIHMPSFSPIFPKIICFLVNWYFMFYEWQNKQKGKLEKKSFAGWWFKFFLCLFVNLMKTKNFVWKQLSNIHLISLY